MSTLQKGFVLCFLSALLFTCKTFAVVETYSQYKTALQIGTDLPNKDEKFKSQFVWQNILSSSVEDAVTLRILDRNILSQDFSCTVTLRIEYFKTPEQSSPDVIEPVQLSLEYKTATGALQKLNDTYTFKDAYQVRIIVTDITSPQYGANIPSFIELGSIINVNRTYKFQEGFPINITADLSGTSNSNTVRELGLGWDFIPGAEEYDLEWATIDEGSERQAILNRMVAKKLSTDPEPEPAELESVFRNNATRVTTHNNKYPVSLILNSRYMAVRIRPAFFNSEGIREEGQWRYKKADDIQFAVWDLQSAVDQQDLTWHEQKLNWQYAATYAEEGKKKEVINYFDGTLRGRQTATINSTDNVAVVQENVYDQYGRPLISILPAPVKENSSGPEYLHFFKDFNKNTSGIAYSFKDILNGCEIKPSALSTDVDFTKASNTYYSPNNIFIKEGSPFKRDVRHDQFIPNADGFPFSVTQYTPDNTGRIRLQGGVGATFQPGLANSKTTKYYYSKPTQWELDRLFGNDVGFANHYLKNMVVDPNGQISVSYLNASGKTIATALAGNAPLSQDALSTATATEQTINLIRPEQFTFDATALTLSATTTHITTVPGKVELKYNI